jgi:hypothetical protein
MPLVYLVILINGYKWGIVLRQRLYLFGSCT